MVAAFAVAVLAATGGGLAGTGKAAKSARLQPFGSCGNLLAYAKQHALPLVGPWGLGGSRAAERTAIAAPSAGAVDARAGVDFSTTNVQEEGVDEPDLVKSNGSTLFVVRADRLFAVDVQARKPKLVDSLALPASSGYELLLEGDRLLILSRGGGYAIGLPVGRISIAPQPFVRKSTLTEVDVSNPSAMRIARSLELDADYVSARLVGSVARVVAVSSMTQAIPFETPVDGTPEATAAAKTRNRAVVQSSGIGTWLPGYRVKGRRGETLSRRKLAQCKDVLRPVIYSGLGLLTVLTIDLRKGLTPIDSDSIVADGRTVYASQKSLYVATQQFTAQPVTDATTDPPGITTMIHKFDISSPTATQYRGTGTVSGYLISQWSLSEHDGVLRVASTEEPTWWRPGPREESQTFVTTLRERDGALAQLGRVGGLGKGERVYAVRFAGDTGYVVTFRQVDPLYTLDLSAPSRPAVLGELKIRGYSAYLHPLGGDLLLGIGQDASDEGRVLGTQLSLFDVSNLRRPTRLHSTALGSSWSEAESDHHAFLWWEPTKLAVLPVQAYNETPFVGAVGFSVGRSGIDEVGRVTHRDKPITGAATRVGGIPIRRSLVVGKSLYTVSDLGVKATGLASFAEEGWAGFPQVSGSSPPSP